MPGISELQARIGWSDAELGRRLDVGEKTIREWRIGRREAPPNLIAWLAQIAAAIEGCPALPDHWRD